jgi:hypothetical protein
MADEGRWQPLPDAERKKRKAAELAARSAAQEETKFQPSRSGSGR